MKSLFNRVWREDEGVLTFEWILLITVLVIGIVGGLSAVRDAVITELGDVAAAVVYLDQSYQILHPWEIKTPDDIQDGAWGTLFIDSAGICENRKVDDSTAHQIVGGCNTGAELPGTP